METTTLDLDKAAARFFSKDYTIATLGFSSGYSGSRFAQVEDAVGRKWCLRCWHPEMSEARLQFIHYTLLHSRSNEFSGVPTLHRTLDGSTFIRQNGCLYDAQEWMIGNSPGSNQTFGKSIPNMKCNLGQRRLTTLASALATFHLSTTGLIPLEGTQSVSLSQRLTLLKDEFDTFRDQLTTREYSAGKALPSLTGKWLERLPHLLILAEALLEAHPHTAQSTSTLCHGDLWAQHVFFDGTRFTGFTDFESLCFSSPATDLAQLILHFKDWNVCNHVMQIYQNSRSLNREEVALLPAAAALDLIGEGCWSIAALHLNGENHLQQRVHHKNLLMFFPAVELILQESGM